MDNPGKVYYQKGDKMNPTLAGSAGFVGLPLMPM
uniref:Uncharacterized protein n=1 Tax=Saccharolobus solfataricus (strain 98/2) TaxID=555311 RepID=D0KNT1_SACS9